MTPPQVYKLVNLKAITYQYELLAACCYTYITTFSHQWKDHITFTLRNLAKIIHNHKYCLYLWCFPDNIRKTVASLPFSIVWNIFIYCSAIWTQTFYYIYAAYFIMLINKWSWGLNTAAGELAIVTLGTRTRSVIMKCSLSPHIDKEKLKRWT